MMIAVRRVPMHKKSQEDYVPSSVYISVFFVYFF